jgi:hypothetical protein
MYFFLRSLAVGFLIFSAYSVSCQSSSKLSGNFFQKLNLWIETNAYSHPEFLEEIKSELHQSTRIKLIVSSIIVSEDWLTERLASVNIPNIEVSRFIHVNIQFLPKQNDQKSYSMRFIVETDIDLDIKTTEKKLNANVTNNTYESPQYAIEDISKEITELSKELIKKYPIDQEQSLSLRLRNEDQSFFHNEIIEIPASGNSTIELELYDAQQTLIKGKYITWTNASKIEDRAIVDLRNVSKKQVTAEYQSNTISVLVQLKADDDLRDKLKEIILELLKKRQDLAISQLKELESGIVENKNKFEEIKQKYDSQNEELNKNDQFKSAGIYHLYANSKKLNATEYKSIKTSAVLNDGYKTAFSLLKNDYEKQRQLRISALVDQLFEDPEKLKSFIEEIIESSGVLLARLLIQNDSKGNKAKAREIITDFVNQKINELTDEV